MLEFDREQDCYQYEDPSGQKLLEIPAKFVDLTQN